MAGRWSQRCCHVPTAGVGRQTGSTGGSGPGAPSWNAPTARDAWGSRRRGRATRCGLRRHDRGIAAHLSSRVRGVRRVSMRARAVTWRRHWSIRSAGSETDAWRRVWQTMATGGNRTAATKAGSRGGAAAQRVLGGGWGGAVRRVRTHSRWIACEANELPTFRIYGQGVSQLWR